MIRRQFPNVVKQRHRTWNISQEVLRMLFRVAPRLKLVLGLVLTIMAFRGNAVAQSTMVFNNLGGHPVKWAPGTPKEGQNVTADDEILVQLLWRNPDTSTFEPVGPPVNTWPLRRGGVFNGGVRAVPVFAPTTAPINIFQIRAWQASFGSDWQTGFNAALAAGGWVHQPVEGQPGDVIQFQSRLGAAWTIPHIPPWGMAKNIPEFQIGHRSN